MGSTVLKLFGIWLWWLCSNFFTQSDTNGRVYVYIACCTRMDRWKVEYFSCHRQTTFFHLVCKMHHTGCRSSSKLLDLTWAGKTFSSAHFQHVFSPSYSPFLSLTHSLSLFLFFSLYVQCLNWKYYSAIFIFWLLLHLFELVHEWKNNCIFWS